MSRIFTAPHSITPPPLTPPLKGEGVYEAFALPSALRGGVRGEGALLKGSALGTARFLP